MDFGSVLVNCLDYHMSLHVMPHVRFNLCGWNYLAMQLQSLSIVLSYSNDRHKVRLTIITCDIYIYIRYLFPYLCISHDNVLTCHQVQSDFNSQMQKWNMGVSSFPKKTESRTRWPRAMHHRTKYKLQRLKFEVICYSRYLQKPATKSS